MQDIRTYPVPPPLTLLELTESKLCINSRSRHLSTTIVFPIGRSQAKYLSTYGISILNNLANNKNDNEDTNHVAQ